MAEDTPFKHGAKQVSTFPAIQLDMLLEPETLSGDFINMSTKELAMETIRDLPEDASWRQIEERIHFMAAIEGAREEVKNGKVTPHDEVRDLLASWISE